MPNKEREGETMTTYTLNNAFNGIEITFDGKPAENIREQLKAAGFRWHNKNKLWYAKQSAERLALAEALASGTAPKAETEKAEPVRDHSLKVGDILASSWGYEQTNNNFYCTVGICKNFMYFCSAQNCFFF